MDKKKINILFLTPSLTWGGMEKIIYQIINGLIKKGFEFTVVYWKPYNFYEKKLNQIGVKTIRINSKIWSLKYFRELIKILKTNRFDIVHSWFCDEDLINVLVNRFLPLNNKISLISSQQAPFFSKRIHFFRYMIIGRFFEKIICCSEWFRQLIIDNCKLNEEKVITIYNSVDLENFPLEMDEEKISLLKRQFNIENSDRVILSVARLSYEKGIDVLLKAMKGVVSFFNNVKLLIAGDGPEKERLISLVKQLNIEKNVIFLGFREDVSEIYYICDIFVLPSREEPFGIVLAEAMAAKKPVCASSVGGIPEVVLDGETGFLVPPDNTDMLEKTLVKMITMPEKDLKKLGENGRKRAESLFSLKEMIDKYETVYRDITGGNKNESS